MPTLITPGVVADLGPALDAEAVGARLHAHLRDRSAAVIACRVVRYRHRPGERCVVQYAVTVRAGGGRMLDERIVGQWSAAPDAGARARKLARRALPLLDTWTAPFPPVFFDAATDMVATTYPFDRRLPGLAEVASGTSAALLAPMRAHLGAAAEAPLDVHVSCVRYREQLNAVARYDLQSADAGGRARAGRYFVKVYGDGGGARLGHVHHALARVTAGAGTVAVAPAVTYVDALGALVTAEAAGTPLDRTSLDRHALETTLHTVAAGLAAFGRLAPGDDLAALAPPPASATRRSVAALTAALPDHGAVLESLASAMRPIDGAVPPAAGLVHGDLKLEHVFVDGPRIHLIDLDSCHRGHAAWDLALLVERWWAARDTASADRPLADWGAHVLTMAYVSRVRLQGVPLPLLRGAASLDVAAGLVKRREPDWQSRALRLIARAARHVKAETA